MAAAGKPGSPMHHLPVLLRTNLTSGDNGLDLASTWKLVLGWVDGAGRSLSPPCRVKGVFCEKEPWLYVDV